MGHYFVTACGNPFLQAVVINQPSVTTASVNVTFALAVGLSQPHVEINFHRWLQKATVSDVSGINFHMWLQKATASDVSSIYTPPSSPSRTVHRSHLPVGGHFGGPDLSKYNGRGFDLDFLEEG
jgi:hypothetical protein